MLMNKKERVKAVLNGNTPDRTPVSFWHHFEGHQIYGEDAVAAHIEHLTEFDLDFLKVMNDNDFPKPSGCSIEEVSQLAFVDSVSGNEVPFLRQLELLNSLRSVLGPDIPITSTIFNPWATLRQLCSPTPPSHGPPKLEFKPSVADGRISEFLASDRKAVGDALLRIAEILGSFAARCIEAGADGVFLSVRDDWVDTDQNKTGTYDELVKPADDIICANIKAGWFNMLHICGAAIKFDRFAKYPFQLLNWADRKAGPSLAEGTAATEMAVAGGVDNLTTLPTGTPQACTNEVYDALAQMKGKPIFITPGCTYDPKLVPKENLFAVCRAARDK